MANEKLTPQEAAALLKKPVDKKPEGRIFTFVDRGSTPVRRVKIHGKQDFHLGKATEVTDPEVLAAVMNNPCFVEGEVDPDEMLARQETAEGEEAKVRLRDKQIAKTEKARNSKFRGEEEKDDVE